MPAGASSTSEERKRMVAAAAPGGAYTISSNEQRYNCWITSVSGPCLVITGRTTRLTLNDSAGRRLTARRRALPDSHLPRATHCPSARCPQHFRTRHGCCTSLLRSPVSPRSISTACRSTAGLYIPIWKKVTRRRSYAPALCHRRSPCRPLARWMILIPSCT